MSPKKQECCSQKKEGSGHKPAILSSVPGPRPRSCPLSLPAAKCVPPTRLHLWSSPLPAQPDLRAILTLRAPWTHCPQATVCSLQRVSTGSVWHLAAGRFGTVSIFPVSWDCALPASQPPPCPPLSPLPAPPLQPTLPSQGFPRELPFHPSLPSSRGTRARWLANGEFPLCRWSRPTRGHSLHPRCFKRSPDCLAATHRATTRDRVVVGGTQALEEKEQERAVSQVSGGL